MKISLITGASSGIGEEFARASAARGSNLLLVARSEGKLASLCDELKSRHKIEAQYVALDLTKDEAARVLFEETRRRALEVEMLINNAGFGSMGDFTSVSLERDAEMIDLNVKALVALTHLFIGPMRERRQGAIINVASTAGFWPVPYMATYAATKAFVLSLSESLWEENREFGVKVLALCPGPTETGFFEAAGGAPAPMRKIEPASKVVQTAFQALEKGRSHVVSGWTNRIFISAGRFAPRSLVTKIVGRSLRPLYKNRG